MLGYIYIFQKYMSTHPAALPLTLSADACENLSELLCPGFKWDFLIQPLFGSVV